jgi:NADH dehydrogenase
VRLVLINAGDRILEGLDSALANAATRRLAALRVELSYDTKAEEIRPDSVSLSDGSAIPTRTTVWAAGVEPPELVHNLDIPKDHSGNLLVDEHLRLKDRPGVYAVGDCTTLDYDGPPVPALAQAAEQEGKVAAHNLAAEFTGDSLESFHYRSLGQLVDLGGESALVDVLGVKTGGTLGELIWKGVYFYELGDNLNRARIFFDWAVDAVSRPDTSRIFF